LTNSHQLLRIAEVSSLTSLAKSTINLWVAQGRFPKPIALSQSIKVWRLQQLNDWIDLQCEVDRLIPNSNEGHQSNQMRLVVSNFHEQEVEVDKLERATL